MPEDRTVLTADGTQYFDVLRRAGDVGDNFARTGDKIGQGFLRGDRAVRTATANIAQGLLTATNAADAALIALQSLERVFRIPLLSTIAASATIAGIAAWRKELLAVEEARDKLQRQLATPLKVQVDLSPEDIAARINSLAAATEEFTRKSQGWGVRLQKLFAGPLLSTPKAIEDANRSTIQAGEERISALSGARADKELRIANAKRTQLGLEKEEIDVQEANLKFEITRAQLVDEFISKGGIVIDFYKRLAAAQVDTATVIDKSMTKLAQKAETLAQDIGSGKFLKDLQQSQTASNNSQSGNSMLSQFRADRANGIPLGPNALAMLAEDDKNRAEAERLNPTRHPGRLAGIGESQDLVDEIERNRIAAEEQNRLLDGSQEGNSGKEGGMGTSMTPDDLIRSAEGFQSLSEHSMDLSDDFIRMSEGLSGLNQQISDLDFRGLAPLSGLTISIQ